MKYYVGEVRHFTSQKIVRRLVQHDVQEGDTVCIAYWPPPRKAILQKIVDGRDPYGEVVSVERDQVFSNDTPESALEDARWIYYLPDSKGLVFGIYIWEEYADLRYAIRDPSNRHYLLAGNKVKDRSASNIQDLLIEGQIPPSKIPPTATYFLYWLLEQHEETDAWIQRAKKICDLRPDVAYVAKGRDPNLWWIASEVSSWSSARSLDEALETDLRPGYKAMAYDVEFDIFSRSFITRKIEAIPPLTPPDPTPVKSKAELRREAMIAYAKASLNVKITQPRF